MIFVKFFELIISVLQVFLFWLPSVTTLNLVLGDFNFPIDDYLTTGMGYIYFIAAVIPPIGILLAGLKWVVYWKLVLLTLKVLRIYRN